MSRLPPIKHKGGEVYWFVASNKNCTKVSCTIAKVGNLVLNGCQRYGGCNNCMATRFVCHQLAS